MSRPEAIIGDLLLVKIVEHFHRRRPRRHCRSKHATLNNYI
jgi:hypothetical protein